MLSCIRISLLTSPVINCSRKVGTQRILHLGPKGTPIDKRDCTGQQDQEMDKHTSIISQLGPLPRFAQKLLHNHLSYLCVHFSAVHGLLQQHLIICLLVDLFLLHSWSLPLPYHYPVWFSCPQSSYLFILIPLS